MLWVFFKDKMKLKEFLFMKVWGGKFPVDSNDHEGNNLIKKI